VIAELKGATTFHSFKKMNGSHANKERGNLRGKYVYPQLCVVKDFSCSQFSDASISRQLLNQER
jgi:hypothetical protein